MRTASVLISASESYATLGRRIQKNVNGTLTRYVYDNEDILLEYDGSNVLKARYTHGPGIDEPWQLERDLNANGQFDPDEVFTYHADALGSIVSMTDSTGAEVRTYRYDTFGQLLAETGTLENPYRFTGREFDPESGLYYYRARHYDPRVGRFVSEDPIGFGGGINFYAYAINNPALWIDPYGLDIWVEGPSPSEPAGHLSINIGDPQGEYDSYSFGVNGRGFFQGEVYRDPFSGGAFYPGSYLKTSEAEDVAARTYLESQVGRTAPYRPWNTCRNFALGEFNQLRKQGYGQSAVPPARYNSPHNPSSGVPFPLSSSATDPTRWGR